MARPSIVGTSVTAVDAGQGTTVDVTMTVPAGANVICVTFSGFNATAKSITSVQGDPTGTPFDIDDIALFTHRGSNSQMAGLWAIYDTNVDWPGTGSVTIRITLSANIPRRTATIFCLTDVGVSGSPTNDQQEAGAASGNPSDVLTSTSEALNVAIATTFSADISGGSDDTEIGNSQNGGSFASHYCWYEDGTGVSDTIESGAGTVDYQMASVSFEGAAAGSTGTGTPAAQVAQAAGSGIREVTGSGTPGAQAGIVTGVGNKGVSGSGVALSGTATVIGVGIKIGAVDLVLTAANNRELRNAAGTILSNLSNIAWEWYDTPGSTAGEPIDSGIFSTDVNGEATISVNNSSLADGEFGQLIVYHPSDVNVRATLRVPVTD